MRKIGRISCAQDEPSIRCSGAEYLEIVQPPQNKDVRIMIDCPGRSERHNILESLASTATRQKVTSCSKRLGQPRHFLVCQDTLAWIKWLQTINSDSSRDYCRMNVIRRSGTSQRCTALELLSREETWSQSTASGPRSGRHLGICNEYTAAYLPSP
jgi:hypothetical protein